MNILWQHPNLTWITPLTTQGAYPIAKTCNLWDWDNIVWGKVRRLVFNLHFEAKVFAVLMRKLLPRKENL